MIDELDNISVGFDIGTTRSTAAVYSPALRTAFVFPLGGNFPGVQYIPSEFTYVGNGLFLTGIL